MRISVAARLCFSECSGGGDGVGAARESSAASSLSRSSEDENLLLLCLPAQPEASAARSGPGNGLLLISLQEKHCKHRLLLIRRGPTGSIAASGGEGGS